MSDPLSSLIRANAGPQLPAFERFAPAPAENVIVAELTARTAPGDVVIDLHGRGGWVARNAIGALRRVYACEATALTRLLAEIVLRPPDLRHFDAGISTLATHPRGDEELRRAIEGPWLSRCPTCGRPIVVEEYIWEADASDPAAPTRKVFHCAFCRNSARAEGSASEPLDEKDIAAAHEMTAAAAAATPTAHAVLLQRFPGPPGVQDARAGERLASEILGAVHATYRHCARGDRHPARLGSASGTGRRGDAVEPRPRVAIDSRLNSSPVASARCASATDMSSSRPRRPGANVIRGWPSKRAPARCATSSPAWNRARARSSPAR